MNKVYKNYNVYDTLVSIIEEESKNYKNLKGSVSELLNLFRKDILFNFSEKYSIKIKKDYIERVNNSREYPNNLKSYLLNIIHAHYMETFKSHKERAMKINEDLFSSIDLTKYVYHINDRIIKDIVMDRNKHGYENNIKIVFKDYHENTTAGNSRRTLNILINIKKLC